MARGKRYQPEQVVNLLRQIEVAIANGKTTAQACKEAEIVEQTYFRWRKEYGGLQIDQAKRLKELEQENAKLKRLVANLSLDKIVLEDFARGNFEARNGGGVRSSMRVRSMGSVSGERAIWRSSHAARSAIGRHKREDEDRLTRLSLLWPANMDAMVIAGSRRWWCDLAGRWARTESNASGVAKG